jgi:uncharacterized GH25 family protein
MKIKGLVTDSLTGQGLAAIKVSCQSPHMAITKRTNARGEFEFEVTRGWWHITVGNLPYNIEQTFLKAEVFDRLILISLDLPGLRDEPVTG